MANRLAAIDENQSERARHQGGNVCDWLPRRFLCLLLHPLPAKTLFFVEQKFADAGQKLATENSRHVLPPVKHDHSLNFLKPENRAT
jgi:hypothetical protein